MRAFQVGGTTWYVSGGRSAEDAVRRWLIMNVGSFCVLTKLIEGHECTGMGLQMHHFLITRRMAQGSDQRWYIHHPYNCAFICEGAHQTIGARRLRSILAQEWARKFGLAEIVGYIEASPIRSTPKPAWFGLTPMLESVSVGQGG